MRRYNKSGKCIDCGMLVASRNALRCSACHKHYLSARFLGSSLHLDKEWLYQKYVVENLSTYDIAKIVKRDPKNIHCTLKRFGIDTRPRGKNLSLEGGDHYMKKGMVKEKNPFYGRKHSDETKSTLRKKASCPKPYLRGKGNGMYGRIGPLNPRYIDGSTPERQKWYNREEWKEVRRQIYARDKHICRRCLVLIKKGYKSEHAHHIVPWAGNESLRFEMSNIVTLCGECHRWVHSKKNTSRDFLS